MESVNEYWDERDIQIANVKPVLDLKVKYKEDGEWGTRMNAYGRWERAQIDIDTTKVPISRLAKCILCFHANLNLYSWQPQSVSTQLGDQLSTVRYIYCYILSCSKAKLLYKYTMISFLKEIYLHTSAEFNTTNG